MWGTYYSSYTAITNYIWIQNARFTDRCCSFLAAITFLAQWHPLIAPERADLRPEYNGGPVASNGMF